MGNEEQKENSDIHIHGLSQELEERKQDSWVPPMPAPVQII